MGGALSRRVFPVPDPPDYHPKPENRIPHSITKTTNHGISLNVFWINTKVILGSSEEENGFDICCCYLTPKDSQTNAWSSNPQNQKKRPLLLLSHENAEDLGGTYRYASAMSRLLGINLVMYDYPGYGYSSGQPTESSCKEAVLAVFDYLRSIGETFIITMGKSLGSGPTIWLASRRKVSGMIIQSGFSSIYNVYLQGKNAMPNIGDMFPNADLLPKIMEPSLIIHGEDDQLINISQAKHLNSLTNHFINPLYIHMGNHNNLEKIGGLNFYTVIQRFICYLWGLHFPDWFADALSSRALTKLDAIRDEEIFVKKRWPKLAGLPKILTKKTIKEQSQKKGFMLTEESQRLARALIIVACFAKAGRRHKLVHHFPNPSSRKEILMLLDLMDITSGADLEVVDKPHLPPAKPNVKSNQIAKKTSYGKNITKTQSVGKYKSLGHLTEILTDDSKLYETLSCRPTIPRVGNCSTPMEDVPLL